MKDIQKEFQLVKLVCQEKLKCFIKKKTLQICARLRLANQTNEITAPTMTPAEIVALLVNANLFDDAVNLAKMFQQDFR